MNASPKSLTEKLSTQVDDSLPEGFRAMIQTRRKEMRLSLKALAAMVGVSDAQLNHVETGARMPTPSLLVRILAALNFGEKEFIQALELTYGTWAGQMIHGMKTPEEMRGFLIGARHSAGISLEELGKRVGASPQYLMGLEQGVTTPSPRFLHLFLMALNKGPKRLAILGDLIAVAIASRAIETVAGKRKGFAKEFVATVFERDGFRTKLSPSSEDCGEVEVELGGGWKLAITARLRFEKEKQENGKKTATSSPKAGKGN